MMRATTDVVLENTAYNAQPLAAIAELDYVPPALEQQESYLADLEKEWVQLTDEITFLEEQTRKEKKEHEALRDSTTRRFAAKITGKKEKFEAKASKEEKEYIEALEKEMQHKRQQETLETLIAEAKALRLDLQRKLERYNKTKQDLAALYSKVFDGPTQAYPEDDQLEYKLQQAQNRYNEIQGSLNRESQALHLLDSADSALEMCCSQLQEALGYSQMDMYGGGHVTDMMERNALTAAQGHASQAKMFVQQAMMSSPQVQLMGQITIGHGSFISDVIFDNIFTDMAFHEKIKASMSNVEGVKSNVIAQYNLTKLRTRGIGADLKVAADALTHARSALNAFRCSVFDSLSGNGNVPPLSHNADSSPPPGPPPQYHEETSYPLGPPPPGPRAASPSAWSNHNPYATMLATGWKPRAPTASE
ncbi:hypothetical protein C8F04DRAFT_1130131 [Mycena alexandri]|uniref:Uncharacterized protein n=1 Tax=Mycena alexandri TaxID=1745969 RepID=A0AAD6SD89_9AGAR|nr:hypothetical protein C8F04DRAFT_1130131 [Mycena alexandri]